MEVTIDLVKDLMTRDPLTIDPQSTLKQTQSIFDQHTFRHLPVMDGDQLVGIISQTDFEKILEGAQLMGKNDEKINSLLNDTRVEKIMTRHPFTIPPDTPVEEVMEIFYKVQFHAIPVIDHGKLMGIVSHHDVFYYIM